MSMPKAERAQLLQQGLAAHRAGDLSAAAALYRHLLRANPSDPDALNLLGIVLHQSGGSDAAAAQCLRAAVKARRKDPALHYNLGTVLSDLGLYAEAEAALRNALRLGSREPHLEMNLANALALQGKLVQALPFYEAARKANPKSSQVWFNYGNALRDLDEAEKALAAYERALEIDPNNVGVWVNKGQLLHRMERLEAAEEAYRKALALGNDDAEIFCSLAQILEHDGRIEEAEVFGRHAFKRRPDYAPTLKVLASVLAKLYRHDEAEQLLRRAVALDATDWHAWSALSALLRTCGRAREALDVLDRACTPSAEAQELVSFQRALAFRELGAYARAWKVLRSEPKAGQPQPEASWITEPLPEALHGERIYVQRDQGLGDELFFLRFVPQLRARGASVVYRCGEKLVSLLERSVIVDELIDKDASTPAVRFAVHVSNLPWALHAASQFDPTPASLRIEPQPERLTALRARLAALGPAPYVGLTWRAGTPLERQQGIKGRVLTKEVDLQAVGRALGQAHGTLIALQRGLLEGELDALRAACGRPVYDFGPWNEELDDALALLALLDDYVGVSNTNMHLVAALGRAAKVLLPFPAEWRWTAQGEGSPFFPGFTLYPQSSDGSWTAALTRLRSDLSES